MQLNGNETKGLKAKMDKGNSGPRARSNDQSITWMWSNCKIDFEFCLLQVKNVSGRLLVGLRWWHEVKDDGSSEWKFECLDEEVRGLMD